MNQNRAGISEGGLKTIAQRLCSVSDGSPPMRPGNTQAERSPESLDQRRPSRLRSQGQNASSHLFIFRNASIAAWSRRWGWSEKGSLGLSPPTLSERGAVGPAGEVHFGDVWSML